jgi:hypothetical protein
MLVRHCLVNSVWAFSHWRDVLHLELAALQQAYRKRGHGLRRVREASVR